MKTYEDLKIQHINEKTAITYNSDCSAVKKVSCKMKKDIQIRFNESVVKVCEAAGRELWSPMELVFPFELRIIESDAFSGSTGIKDINFNDKLLRIGSYAFSGTSISVLNIPDNVEEIGKEAFSECRDLKQVLSFGKVNAIYEACFADCINLEKINIPASVTFIDDFAFYNCQKLTEITLPKSVEVISESAFAECENLKTIYMSQKTYDNNPDFVKKYKDKIKIKSKVAEQVFDMNFKTTKKEIER